MGDGDPVSSGQHDLLISVNDQTFEQMIEMSDRPAFVMFQSATCQHCRTITPYIREYAGEFAGRVLFATLEVGQNPRAVERFGIRSTPIIKRQIEDFLLHGSECATNSTEIDYDISGYA